METNEHKKGVLITIIVGLLIFFPLTVSSIVLKNMKIEDKRKMASNPNHEFFFDGSLYFYDELGELLGTYACTTTDCNYAKNKITDEKYSIDYYKEGGEFIPVINQNYVFLTDVDNHPFLYDLSSGKSVTSYVSVKDYGIGLENNCFIVENDQGLFGILSLENGPELKVPFNFDFIGVVNFINEEENKLMSDFFVGKKDNDWYLIDQNGATLTGVITREIVTYNGKNIIVEDLNGFYLVDYQDVEILENGPFEHLSFTGKYLNILSTENEFYVYDLTKKEPISKTHQVKPTDKISSKINTNGKLEIILNEKVIETVAIL